MWETSSGEDICSNQRPIFTMLGLFPHITITHYNAIIQRLQFHIYPVGQNLSLLTPTFYINAFRASFSPQNLFFLFLIWQYESIGAHYGDYA